MLEVPLRDHVFVEVDGLYRPAHMIDGTVLADGSIRNGEGSALLTWEFPILAKYKMSFSKVAPLIEAGPSFRAIGHGDSEDHSHHGSPAESALQQKWRE